MKCTGCNKNALVPFLHLLFFILDRDIIYLDQKKYEKEN